MEQFVTRTIDALIFPPGTIRYSLPQPMRVRLQVFDVLGRAVATLVNEQQQRGLYEVPFEAGARPEDRG